MRYYLIGLARTLGKTVNQLLDELTHDELIEQIAYDRLQDPLFKSKIEQSQRTPEQQEAWILQQLGD